MIVVVSRDIQHWVQSISQAPKGTWDKGGTLANKNVTVNINFPEMLLWHGYIRISGHFIENIASKVLPSVTSLHRRPVYQICKYDLWFLGKQDWSKSRKRPKEQSAFGHVWQWRGPHVYKDLQAQERRATPPIFLAWDPRETPRRVPHGILGGTAERWAWLGGTGWGLAHGVGSTGRRGDPEQAGDWPVSLHSLNFTTHCGNCKPAPRKMAPKRDHF